MFVDTRLAYLLTVSKVKRNYIKKESLQFSFRHSSKGPWKLPHISSRILIYYCFQDVKVFLGKSVAGNRPHLGSHEKVVQSISLAVLIHYSQEDLVVIEFTGQGPSTRKASKSEALANDF